MFEEVSRGLLASGHHIRFQARGRSMLPLIRDGETLCVEPVPPRRLRIGDIIVAKTPHGLRAHRLVFKDVKRDCFLTRGDAGQESDPPISSQHIIGRVVLGTGAHLRARFYSAVEHVMEYGRRWRRSFGVLVGVLIVGAGCTLSHAQVVMNDTTTSAGIRPNVAGNPMLTVAHTIAVNPNLLVVVGLSINLTNSPGAHGTGVTYNGVAMTQLGFHVDAGGTRRVEIWYLTAPSTGTHNAVATINLPTAAGRVGIVGGVMSFRGVDQTTPLSAMVSNDGAAGLWFNSTSPAAPIRLSSTRWQFRGNLTVTKGPSATLAVERQFYKHHRVRCYRIWEHQCGRGQCAHVGNDQREYQLVGGRRLDHAIASGRGGEH